VSDRGDAKPRSTGDPILPLPPKIEPLRHVRSTILIASVANIRNSGRFDEYAKRVPAEHHSALFESVAGVWIPFRAAAAHYVACESLGVPVDEQVNMGRATVDRVGATIAGTAVRLAKQAGVTPLHLFPHLQRFWMRGYDGGALAIYQVGPKEARLELVHFPLCEIPFYRRALTGWTAGLTGLFCAKLYMKELPQPSGPHSMALRAQWV
jgi:hypothetical protein